jgi:hypothetical protein
MQEHGNEQNFPFNMQNRIHRSEEPDKEQRAIKRPKEQKKKRNQHHLLLSSKGIVDRRDKQTHDEPWHQSFKNTRIQNMNGTGEKQRT